MMHPANLQRFIDAQEQDYDAALAEIKNGQKRSHWMWYIFPQIQGLGYSSTSKYYAIRDLKEAEAYLKDPLLGSRLTEICGALLSLKTNNAGQVLGSPDGLKLKSCMTLFAAVAGANPVFQQVLDKFYRGLKDTHTLQQIS